MSGLDRGVEPFVGNRNVNILKARQLSTSEYDATNLNVSGTAAFTGDASFGGTVSVTGTFEAQLGSTVNLGGAAFIVPITAPDTLAAGTLFYGAGSLWYSDGTNLFEVTGALVPPP